MFEFPRNDQHVAIMGRTGSGKTQLGTWLLSHSDYDRRPHIIIDYKGDDLLNAIPYAQHIKFKDTPKKPGVYILHVRPGQDDQIESFLWNTWAQENTHLHVDEGYMINKNSKAYNACLTQGRSKRVSVTTLTQRPAYCSRFVFSEATHMAVFHMNDRRDKDTIEGFFPEDLDEPLPEYHSKWYNVKSNKILKLPPVPDGASILDRFAVRLKPKRTFL